MTELRDAIKSTLPTDAFVAFEEPLSQVPGIASDFPFFGAPIGTEGKSAWRYFQVAPAAQTSAVLSFRQDAAVRASAGHCTL